MDSAPDLGGEALSGLAVQQVPEGFSREKGGMCGQPKPSVIGSHHSPPHPPPPPPSGSTSPPGYQKPKGGDWSLAPRNLDMESEIMHWAGWLSPPGPRGALISDSPGVNPKCLQVSHLATNTNCQSPFPRDKEGSQLPPKGVVSAPHPNPSCQGAQTQLLFLGKGWALPSSPKNTKLVPAVFIELTDASCP